MDDINSFQVLGYMYAILARTEQGLMPTTLNGQRTVSVRAVSSPCPQPVCPWQAGDATKTGSGSLYPLICATMVLHL